MSTPTRQEIIAMHRSLNRLCDLAAETAAVPARINEKILRDALPPLPRPTMAEVEWDDDKHYLAEAEHPGWGKVIMLERSACPGFIRFALAKENEPTWQAAEEKTLTPTGKRYTLTEIKE